MNPNKPRVSTGISCPNCGGEIMVPSGPWVPQFLATLKLRFDTIGTQMHCNQCRKSFLHRDSSRPATQPFSRPRPATDLPPKNAY